MAAAIPGIIKACAVFTMFTGSLNVALGLGMLGGPTVFTPRSESSALADSQIRYLGAVMASASWIVWWASNNVPERQVPLAMLGVGAFAGGIGRLVAGIKHGFGPRMKIAMWIELVLPTVLYGFGKAVGQW